MYMFYYVYYIYIIIYEIYKQQRPMVKHREQYMIFVITWNTSEPEKEYLHILK